MQFALKNDGTVANASVPLNSVYFRNSSIDVNGLVYSASYTVNLGGEAGCCDEFGGVGCWSLRVDGYGECGCVGFCFGFEGGDMDGDGGSHDGCVQCVNPGECGPAAVGDADAERVHV